MSQRSVVGHCFGVALGRARNDWNSRIVWSIRRV
jgi:hypothetical protein